MNISNISPTSTIEILIPISPCLEAASPVYFEKILRLDTTYVIIGLNTKNIASEP